MQLNEKGVVVVVVVVRGFPFGGTTALATTTACHPRRSRPSTPSSWVLILGLLGLDLRGWHAVVVG